MLSPLYRSLSPLGVGQSRAAATWNDYVQSLSPVLWYRFDEASGTLLNYGSGTNGNSTSFIGSITQGVTGQLGLSQAYTLTLNSRVQVDYDASWADVPVWEWTFLVKTTTGGNTNSNFIGRDAGPLLRYNIFSGQLNAFIRNPPSADAQAQASNNFITFGAYALISYSYNDTTDRVPHIYKDAVECSYSSTVAATGVYQGMTNGLSIGANQALSSDFVGDFDEAFLTAYVLDSTIRGNLKTFAGL